MKVSFEDPRESTVTFEPETVETSGIPSSFTTKRSVNVDPNREIVTLASDGSTATPYVIVAVPSAYTDAVRLLEIYSEENAQGAIGANKNSPRRMAIPACFIYNWFNPHPSVYKTIEAGIRDIVEQLFQKGHPYSSISLIYTL